MLSFRHFGIVELIIVLVLALLFFGPGRIAKLGSEVGKAIGGFKREMGTTTKSDDEETA